MATCVRLYYSLTLGFRKGDSEVVQKEIRRVKLEQAFNFDAPSVLQTREPAHLIQEQPLPAAAARLVFPSVPTNELVVVAPTRARKAQLQSAM